jgi:hypothetical protein
MNKKRRECAMCKKPIAYRVWARWDGGTEPPPAHPYPSVMEAITDPFRAGSMSYLLGDGKTTQQRVCADHIEHFEKGWSRMSGLEPGEKVVVGHEPCKPPPPLPKGHNIKPDTYYDGTLKHTTDFESGALWVECRTWSPESAIGRPVTLYIPPEMLVPMLNLLKESAIGYRQQSLAEAEKAQLDKAN